MPKSVKICKPVDQLQLNDIEVYPIWEFASYEEGNEEQNETWVRPVFSNVVQLNQYSLSVAAEFETSSGKNILGIVGVSTFDGVEFSHGALLHNGKYIFVPSPSFFNYQNEKESVALALGEEISNVFPLQFTLKSLIEGKTVFRRAEFG